MPRWLVRFGYDGRPFAGWARQPGLRTVEGEILHGIRGSTKDAGPSGPSVPVASRTDRGVSARANALTVESALSPERLLRQLNGISADIFFQAARRVPERFNPRRAVRRTYRYYLPVVSAPLESWRRAAERLTGLIDVRSFGRALPQTEPVLRSVESLSIDPIDGGLQVEIRAPSFVWGEVRKIVGALAEHASGRLSLHRLQRAARGEERLTLPLAPPEGLVLWEVEYAEPWEVWWNGPNRYQVRRRAELRDRVWTDRRLLDAVVEMSPSLPR